MTAELLREAAELMRTRAQAAKPKPSGLCDEWFETGCPDLSHLRPVEQDHIASWSPAVALNVAYLLDHMAYLGDIDESMIPDTGRGRALLDVARAYLGIDEPIPYTPTDKAATA